MSNKTLDFNKPLIQIDGKAVEGSDNTLGKILAGVMSQEASEDKYEFTKQASWIRKLWDGEPLLLDKADHDKLKEFVEKKAKTTGWVKAQLFEVLESDAVSSKSEDGEHIPHPGQHPKRPKK